MKRNVKKVLAGCMTMVMAVSAMLLTGCGGKSGASGDRTVIEYLYLTDQYSADIMTNLIKTYNEGQGAEDGVYVNGTPVSGEYSNYQGILSRECDYSVVTVTDNQFKTLAVKDYFLPLDDYLTDEVKEAMDYDQIPEDLTNAYRLTVEKDADGYYLAGEGTNTLGIPTGSSPAVIYYSTAAMDKCGINVISVAEEALAEKYPNVKPHGYAEYKESPFDGAVSSVNEAGQTVYKVFNNRIPMNWEENRILARQMQSIGNYEYGFCNEYWFSYGWSVGGDCIGWNDETKVYDFTVADTSDNWLALDTVTINDTTYEAGEVLYHEDATSVNSGKVSSDNLYKLPSQYDAFLEFTRYSVPTTSEVDNGVKGYGIAQNSKENNPKNFLGGITAMNVGFYSAVNSYSNSSLGSDWDMAPMAQYREYVGGSTYQRGGVSGFANEHLKVIGETYDGVVYTGEVAVSDNGVKLQGRASTTSRSNCVAIPRQSDESKYEAAVKFIAWLTGPEGQTMIAESNSWMPNQVNIGMSDDFNTSESRKCKNAWAAAFGSQNGDIGDYHYFSAKTWINDWADTLNYEVRLGKKTISAFLDERAATATENLKAMNVRMLGR